MIYTVGHSTLDIYDLADVMQEAGIDVLWDIRSHPTSKWRQHQKTSLEWWVPHCAGIAYEWRPELGGWRDEHYTMDNAEEFRRYGIDLEVYARGSFPKHHIAESIAGSGWTNQGLHDYSWFMSTDEFIQGAEELIDQSRERDIAIMCAEILPWKCHRSMVADYLVWRGVDPVHLQPRVKKHSEWDVKDRLDRYDERIKNEWRQHDSGE